MGHRQLEAGPVDTSALAVLFVHGFSELWYSWHHQMGYLTARGYRYVAPDLQGYGGTTALPESSSYTVFHIVGDLIALVDALHVPQVPARNFVPPFLVESNSPTKLHMHHVCGNVSQEWR